MQRSFKCIHSLKEFLQSSPNEDLRLRENALPEVRGKCEAGTHHWCLQTPHLSCPLLREAGDPFPSQQSLGPQLCPREACFGGGLGHREGLCGALLVCTQSKSELCSLKGPEQCQCRRLKRGRCRTGDARLGLQRDGAQVRETDPFPAPQAGSQAHASPRFSAKFHLGPPGGARGRWRGRGRGTPEGPSGVYPVSRGGRLRSVGLRSQGSGFRGVGRSVKPDSGGCTLRDLEWRVRRRRGGSDAVTPDPPIFPPFSLRLPAGRGLLPGCVWGRSPGPGRPWQRKRHLRTPI